MLSDFAQFRDLFFDEAAEHLSTMEIGLLALSSEGADDDQLNAIFRAAHSIKGSAGSVGLSEISTFTHGLENILDRMRRRELAASEDLVALLLTATDTVRTLVEAARQGNADPIDVSTVSAALHAALGAPKPAAPVAPKPAPTPVHAPKRNHPYQIHFAPKPRVFFSGHDPLLVVRELGDICTHLDVRVNTTSLPPLAELDPERSYLEWDLTIETKESRDTVETIFLFIEDECELTITSMAHEAAEQSSAPAVTAATAAAPVPALSTERRAGADRRAGSSESSSIRVSIDKIDAMVDLVGELVISQAMVNQIVEDFDISRLPELREALGMVDRNTREFQERVMSVRMLPVSTVFSRFPRLVHDAAATLNKRVRLETEGGETELDKGMIERLSDPLTHLVRNSLDHGIEFPQDREQAGKSPEAVLTLRAFHEGGNVIVEVADDGRGLNTARIQQKALEQGLVRADQELSEAEIHALIFAPGFSTAAQVSDLSGRGVGMDVVKRNVEALNGSVSIRSEPGKGTRVQIRLPLTLAILDGLTVRVGKEAYVLPLLSIVETLRPVPSDVRTLLGKGEVLVVRGESLPFIRLHATFGLEDATTEPSLGIVAIVESAGRRYGLLIDEVIGQQQIVIKNLEANYRKLDAVMGATILGDGRVALILDVQELFRSAISQGGDLVPVNAASARDVTIHTESKVA